MTKQKYSLDGGFGKGGEGWVGFRGWVGYWVLSPKDHLRSVYWGLFNSYTTISVLSDSEVLYPQFTLIQIFKSFQTI